MIFSKMLALTLLFLSAPICCSVFSTRRLNQVKENNKRAQEHSFPDIPASKDLIWYPCYTNFSCSALTVPLSYLSSPSTDNHTSYLPLIRLPATQLPYAGLVFVNPGGPGASGIESLLSGYAAYLIDPTTRPYFGVIPGNFDIVAWDPRGMGYNSPSARCVFEESFEKPSYRRIKRDIGSESAGKGGDARVVRDLNVRAREEGGDINIVYGYEMDDSYFVRTYAWAQTMGEACARDIGAEYGAGPHMSTTVVAKDLISILDAFARSEEAKNCHGDPSLLNYWGLSYGTFIGEIFATLFSDRVGRMVLDGVIDPIDWVATGERASSNTIKELTFSLFFVYCHAAGPEKCEFWEESPYKIFLRFEALVLPLNPILAFEQGWENATKIEFVLSALKSAVPFRTIKTHFPALSKQLVEFEKLLPHLSQTNISVFEELWQYDAVVLTDPTWPWFAGVYCSDQGSKTYGLSYEEILPVIRLNQNDSFFNGEHWSADPIVCTGWSIKGVDVYEGPFGGKTRNPLLFVSNTLDQITPIGNGRIAAALFEGSKLLTVDGSGHTTSSIGNQCAFKNIAAFLTDGQLLTNGDYCPLQAGGPWNVTLIGPLPGGQ